jgi:ABC-2 type transport system ATP-binding protein
MRMWEYIKGVNNEGTTIFLTTHYMDEADQLSDRISIIDQGKIIISGKPWELKNTLGQDLIYMETNDNEAAIRLLKDLPSVRNVKPKTKGFVLMVNEDGTKVLPVVIDALRNAGIVSSTINLKKPSMDDVFVFYTGKELRDEPTGKAVFLTMRTGGR